MAEVFLECTHSLTQQVKKKKEKRRTKKPFGNQERERDCYLNSIAPKKREYRWMRGRERQWSSC